MRIIDISREVISSKVYPGDPKPKIEKVLEINRGDECNLSVIHACTHNATHIDAPLHYIENAEDILGISLEKCIGKCYVCDHINEEIIQKYRKIIIRGLLIDDDTEIISGLDLIGTDALTIGDDNVHKNLLKKDIVILEGVDISNVKNGEYQLVSLPIKIASADGSFVRAILIEN